MNQKVCILTSVHYPYDTRIFTKQATTLAQHGYDVTLIARGNRDPSIKVPDGLTMHLLSESSNRINRFTGLFQFIRTAIKQDADVYHIHDPELLLSVPILKLMTEASIIYDIHEDVRSQISKKSWLADFLKPIAREGYGFVERITLPIIDEIILAEDSYKSQSQYKKAQVVRNYPKIDDFLNSKKPNDESIKLVYIGGISQPRGAMELIEVAKVISYEYSIKFQFIGGFSSDSFRDELMNVVEESGLESSVEFTGRLPFDEAIQEVAKADIGYAILHKEPNFTGSIPTKLFEYMMCGIPVIISDVEEWERIVTTNECGIAVSPSNLCEITAATKNLIEDPERRLKLGRNGRLAVENKYRWEKEAIKLINIYDGLINSPH